MCTLAYNLVSEKKRKVEMLNPLVQDLLVIFKHFL